MGSPALMDAQSTSILALLASLAAWQNTHVIGGAITDGGTTQATGASGALNFDVDVSQIIDCTIGGQPREKIASTDVDATAGASVVWGATSGKAVVFAVVIDGGSANDQEVYDAIPGAVANTGSQVAPTDAEITAALGHSNWVRVGDVTITRTGDLTVTVAVDHTVRPRIQGVATLAETEAAFRAG